MRLVVVTEQRIVRDPSGTHWTAGGMGYEFWSRYRTAFEDVRVVARVTNVKLAPHHSIEVDGDGVHVWPVPFYEGIRGYISKHASVREAVRSSTSPLDAVLLRVPSRLGTILACRRGRAGLPYALEVVGDPNDVFAKGAVSTSLRPLLRARFTKDQKSQARNAIGVAYVTERTLQNRYPASSNAITSSYSSVELASASFAESARTYEDLGKVIRLISVGSLEQKYKGIDVLLEAVRILRDDGVDVSLTHLGDGRFKPLLRDLAHSLRISDHVTFVGQVRAGDDVRNHLIRSDLFVHPSLTEGLPRALIEAMALGLPAIASTAGGSPELLTKDCLVTPGDAPGLARSIHKLSTDRARLSRSSYMNLNRAQDFKREALDLRRTKFYSQLRESFDGLL